MDTLPHNGAVITLLAVTGLTHRESYREIFAVTVIKTLAVFFVIDFQNGTQFYRHDYALLDSVEHPQ
jgi:H+/gluconate symporter-like permease